MTGPGGFHPRKVRTMQIREIEGRVLESRVREGKINMVTADGLQRVAPVGRDAFDDLLLSATRFAFDEGSWDTFHYGVTAYRNLTRHSSCFPALVPRKVFNTVTQALESYSERRHSDEPLAPGCLALSEQNYSVGQKMVHLLGGEDQSDGVRDAGRRTFSHMMAARISDGFVHPAVGGHLWGQYLSIQTGPISGGPHVEVMRDIGRLSELWVSAAEERPETERAILAHAHNHRWPEPDPTSTRSLF